MNRQIILLAGILLIAAHNLLDRVHVPGNGLPSFLWSILHEPGYFTSGNYSFHVHYPLLPWIGMTAIGYFFGSLFTAEYDAAGRRKIFLSLGIGSILLFIILRSGNFYGDAAHWSMQKTVALSFLSFLNVSKYPPSLLYTLITLGPAFIFLALFEKTMNVWTARIAIYGRTPMFYYLAHILLIHLFAVIGAVVSGYKWSDMILTTMVNSSPQLKGYGFNLTIVYIIWIGLVLLLFPCCKWFDRYKRSYQSAQWWLTYI
jgi:uncharacterized membrane protein